MQVVIAFRGTASLANVLEDLQVVGWALCMVADRVAVLRATQDLLLSPAALCACYLTCSRDYITVSADVANTLARWQQELALPAVSGHASRLLQSQFLPCQQ